MRVKPSRIAVAVTLAVLAFLAVVLIANPPPFSPRSPSEAYRSAEEAAKNMRGEVGLTVRKEAGSFEWHDYYVLLDPKSAPPVTPPSGFKLVSAVMDKRTGIIYLLFVDANPASRRLPVELVKHKLAIVKEGVVKFVDLKFRKVGEKVVNGSTYTTEVYTNKGVEKMRGVSQCRITYYRGYVDESLPLETAQLTQASIYFDCTYTTYLGWAEEVTTHARGIIYYIPNAIITGIADYSYDEIHDPLVHRCSFTSRAEGVGTVVATVKAEGRYHICWWELTSTQWYQYSQFSFNVWEQQNCEGRHNAWAAFGCPC